MKFSHKIVAASSALLLATVTLLTLQQYYTVKSEIRSQVTSSVNEIVDGVRDTTGAEINSRKAIAAYATSMLEVDLSPKSIEAVLTRPVVKETFLLAGLGFEKDGSNINNDPSWNPGPTWDPRVRP